MNRSPSNSYSQGVMNTSPVNNPRLSLNRQASASGNAYKLKLETRRHSDPAAMNNKRNSYAVKSKYSQGQSSPKRPSAENSYLKSRRSQARKERRSNIMEMVDRNLDQSDNSREEVVEPPKIRRSFRDKWVSRVTMPARALAWTVKWYRG